jgi:hypothetical protein
MQDEEELKRIVKRSKVSLKQPKPATIQTYECDLCKKSFNKNYNYHRHIRMHFLNEIMNHQHDPAIDAELSTAAGISYPKFYECDQCARKFNENKQLAFHKQKWHLNTYECTHCQASQITKFAGKFEYIKHLNLMHEIKFKFECKHCFKQFKYLSHYIQHRKTHKSPTKHGEEEQREEAINNENNKCDVCGRQFSCSFNLKRHVTCRHGDTTLAILQGKAQDDDDDSTASSKVRLKFDCNSSQKSFYEKNKLNFHLNKIQINK